MRNQLRPSAGQVGSVDIKGAVKHGTSLLQLQIRRKIQREHVCVVVFERNLSFVVGVVEQIDACRHLHVEYVMRIARYFKRDLPYGAEIAEEIAENTGNGQFLVLFAVHSELKIEFEVGKTSFLVNAVLTRRTEIVSGKVHLYGIGIAYAHFEGSHVYIDVVLSRYAGDVYAESVENVIVLSGSVGLLYRFFLSYRRKFEGHRGPFFVDNVLQSEAEYLSEQRIEVGQTERFPGNLYVDETCQIDTPFHNHSHNHINIEILIDILRLVVGCIRKVGFFVEKNTPGNGNKPGNVAVFEVELSAEGVTYERYYVYADGVQQFQQQTAQLTHIELFGIVFVSAYIEVKRGVVIVNAYLDLVGINVFYFYENGAGRVILQIKSAFDDDIVIYRGRRNIGINFSRFFVIVECETYRKVYIEPFGVVDRSGVDVVDRFDYVIPGFGVGDADDLFFIVVISRRHDAARSVVHVTCSLRTRGDTEHKRHAQQENK